MCHEGVSVQRCWSIVEPTSYAPYSELCIAKSSAENFESCLRCYALISVDFDFTHLSSELQLFATVNRGLIFFMKVASHVARDCQQYL